MDSIAHRRLVFDRFRGLTTFGKVAFVLVILLVGAGLTEATHVLFFRPDAQSLRGEVQRRIDAQDYVGARRALETLAAVSPAGLSEADRWDLGEPVQRGLSRLGRDLRAEVEEHRAAGRWDAALASLREMRRTALEADWAAYTEAEVLRAAGRLEAAADAYVAYADEFPTSTLADDALYWAGMVRLATHRIDEARQLWRRLTRAYPSSTWRAEVERHLERTAPSAALHHED